MSGLSPLFFVVGSSLIAAAVASAPAMGAETYDVIIRNGTIYDGSGSPAIRGDVAVRGDRIAVVGDVGDARGTLEVDAQGLAVAPGFINMLSWAVESLYVDGRGQSDIRQGVTLEVFGEGWSWGPFNDSLRDYMRQQQGEFKYDVNWTTLAEYLQLLADRGVSPNIASFVGATTVRAHVVGFDDRRASQDELERMGELVRREMEAGALGVGSSLIYAPAFYADTEELIAICKVAAEYDGLYISHMRSEGNRLLEAVDELIRIAKEANIRAEIYHLKAAGAANWPKGEQVIEKVEQARQSGLQITADMYTYTAGSTGLNAAMPPWVQAGGYVKWRERLMDPETRKKVLAEMRAPTDDWENLMMMAGSPDKVLLVGFMNPKLRKFTGKTLADAARELGVSPEDAAIDLVIEDGSRVEAVYFVMNEDNVRKNIAIPWVSFGSDAGALAPEGVFLNESTHPRAYGNFARLLGKYVREEKVIPLETAIHKLTALPAANLRIKERGSLQPGYFADIVVFDPAKIADHATYENPLQYATGVEHLFVNGVQVLKDGEHTGAKPGRVVWGPGRKESE
jgi:N-acyl-D-amino-acid deacylase